MPGWSHEVIMTSSSPPIETEGLILLQKSESPRRVPPTLKTAPTSGSWIS